MKRIFAFILSIAMLAGICIASAETPVKTRLGTLNVNGAFDLKCKLPDGYGLDITQSDTTQIQAFIKSEDEKKPVMTLRIAFDELLSQVDRLNDLDDNALASIEATFSEEDDVKITYRYTAYGTKLLVAELDGEYIDFYTIYKGYAIEFLLSPGTEPMTDEQVNMVVSFLSDLDFDSAN